ncbi:hypothetical protein [Burkholderia sola]|uniref:Tse2 family ADP-ribosyltransferase toxin n=1 Tax=Burkholderia sola TaxID=2843302 RepID=UPI003F49AE91
MFIRAEACRLSRKPVTDEIAVAPAFGQHGDDAIAGWVWRFKQGTYIPGDLRIIPDGKDHYVIAPLRSMPLDKYKGLLEEMAMSATREFNKK